MTYSNFAEILTIRELCPSFSAIDINPRLNASINIAVPLSCYSSFPPLRHVLVIRRVCFIYRVEKVNLDNEPLRKMYLYKYMYISLINEIFKYNVRENVE